jgi:hypothetical protein
MVYDRIYVFPPPLMVWTMNNFNHLYIFSIILVYTLVKRDLVCGAEAP